MKFIRKEKKNADIMSKQIVQALQEIAEQFGMTTAEATNAITTLSNYLQTLGYGLPSNYENVLDELRTVSGAKTENPKQKTDLEIFPLNAYKDKKVILEAENSKWDTNLLDEYFPHWREPNAFSTEPYLKEEFQIKYDDDWIREILEEV